MLLRSCDLVRPSAVINRGVHLSFQDNSVDSLVNE